MRHRGGDFAIIVDAVFGEVAPLDGNDDVASASCLGPSASHFHYPYVPESDFRQGVRMPDDDGNSPAVRLWRLKIALRLAREKAGLTQEEVAEAMEWSLSKLVRFERGTIRIPERDLKGLLRLYEIGDIGNLYEIGDIGNIDDLVMPATLTDALWPTNAYRHRRPPSQLWKDLSGDDFERAIEAQLAPANLVLPPAPTAAETRTAVSNCDSNESFWGKVLNEGIRANATVTLTYFLLFEWFPRSPGLFHTKRGKFAREDAADHRILRSTEKYSSPEVTVYDLYGKIRMLEGGLGCIRLLPKKTENGTLWFMSASSTTSAHEGVPVAMRNSHYNRCISYISTYGVMPCSIIGTLKFLPKPLLSLYGDYTDVPGLYLLVEEVEPASSPTRLPKGPPLVSVAVTFGADISQVSAAYVSFVPGDSGSIASALEWLDRYVDSYGGTVVTDFDEQMRRFSGAVFSLDKVCNGRLSESEMRPFTAPWYYRSDPVVEGLLAGQDRLIAYRINIGEVNVSGDVFSNIGSGAVVVNRSSLSNAMNVVGKMADEETVNALQQVASLIERSGNSDALENFNAFNDELQQPQPRKSLLNSLWNGVLATLPSIATLTDATAKIASLFH